MFKTALYLALVCFVFSKAASSQGSSMHQAKALLQMVKDKHYSPRTVNDTLSEFLFTQFFENIDPDRIFFTQQDIKGLDSYRKTLDDELNGKGWTFLSKIIPLYRLRLMQADTIINEITTKAFDFTANEFFSEQADTSWPANEKDKKVKWNQTLKLETLNGLADNALIQYNQSKNIDKKEILTKEMQVRLMIRSRHQRHIKSILQSADGFDTHVQNIYLDALATCFDPHTNFCLKPKSKILNRR